MRETGIFTLGGVVAKLSSAVLLPIYLLLLTPEDLGLLALSNMVMPVLSAIWTFGLSVGVGRFYYEYPEEERRSFVGTHFIVERSACLIGLAATLLTGPRLFPFFIKSVPYDPYIRLVIWTAFFNTFMGLPRSLMRVRQEAHMFVFTSLLTFVVTTGANIYLVAILRRGVEGVLIGNLVGSIAAAVGCTVYLLRYIQLRFDYVYIRRTRQFALPLLPELVLGSIVNSFDRYLLDKWIPLGAIGVYSVARQLGGIAEMVIQGVKTAYSPFVFRVWGEGGGSRTAREEIDRLTLWFVLITCLIAASVMLFSREFLVFLGRPQFTQAVFMLPAVILIAILQVLYNVLFMSFAISEDTRLISLVFFIHSGLVLSLSAFFIPLLGIWGALLSAVLSSLGRVILTYWWGERRHHLFTCWRTIITLELLVLLIIPLSLWGLESSLLHRLTIKSAAFAVWTFLVIRVAGFPFREYLKRAFWLLREGNQQKEETTDPTIGKTFTFVDTDKIYNDTLFHSEIVRPWAFVNGKYLALELKYLFVKQYLREGEYFDVKTSAYYQFLQKCSSNGFREYYDGNEIWAYADADSLCTRFLVLIEMIIKYRDLYDRLTPQNLISSLELMYDDIIAFERLHPVKIYYVRDGKLAIRKESDQYSQTKEILKRTIEERVVGHLVPTAMVHKSRIILLNGSHRLAIFKALKEEGLMCGRFPIFIIRSE